MITLELSEEEARNLSVFLSMHDTNSEYSTFSTYEQLMDKMDEGLSYDDRVIIMVSRLENSRKIRERTTRAASGLIMIGDKK